MRRLAVLSLHTSPLAQPGTGDGGGMNVYVRELSSALARAGVDRATSSPGPAPTTCRPSLEIEPGFRLHHVAAGPPTPLPKEALLGVVDEFADGVLKSMSAAGDLRRRRRPALRRGARQLLAERDRRPRHQAPARPAAGLDVPHPRPGQGRGQPRGGRGPLARTSGPRPRRRSSAVRTRSSRPARSRPPRSPSSTAPTRRASASSPPVSTTPSSVPATVPRPGGPSASPSRARSCSSWAGSSR